MDLPRGPVSPTDLLLDHPQDKSKATHFFDFVGPVAFDSTLQSQVCLAAKDGRFADMPAPFRLKTSPGMSYSLQLVVLPLPNGQHFLLKHIIFPDQVKAEFVSTLCHGEVHAVSWQGNAKNGPMGLLAQGCVGGHMQYSADSRLETLMETSGKFCSTMLL